MFGWLLTKITGFFTFFKLSHALFHRAIFLFLFLEDFKGIFLNFEKIEKPKPLERCLFPRLVQNASFEKSADKTYLYQVRCIETFFPCASECVVGTFFLVTKSRLLIASILGLKPLNCVLSKKVAWSRALCALRMLRTLDQATFFDFFLLRGLRPLKASAIPEAGAEA